MTERAKKGIKGYSLKSRRLRRWIYQHKRTMPYVARKMGIGKKELKRKLHGKELFNKEQIRGLVYLVGAKEAIEIIYFPTIQEKAEVKQKVFGEDKGGKEI